MLKREHFRTFWMAYGATSGWSLLAFRVALGLTCAGDALFTYLEVADFIEEPQLFPPGMTTQFNPLDSVPPGALTTACFLFVSLLGLLFALGVPGVRFVLPLALAMIRHRVPLVENGGMAVLQLALVCTWMMPINELVPLGSYLRSRKDPKFWNRAETALDKHYFSWGFPLICLQLAVNYGYNAYNKLTDPWKEGIAVSRALSNPNLVHGLGVWVSDLPPTFLEFSNHSALLVEGALPLLLLSPFARRQSLLAASVLMVALHSFIALTLMVGIFSYAMLSHVPLLCLSGFSRRTSARSREKTARPREIAVPLGWRRRVSATFAALFVYVLCWSLDSMWHRSGWFPLPQPLVQVTEWMRTRQGWGMFAHPLDRAFINVTEVVTESGERFDPWRSLVSPVESPRGRIPRVAYRRHGAFDVDAYALASDKFREHFTDWLWERTQARQPSQRISSLAGWTLEVPAEKQWLVPALEIDRYVGAYDVPWKGALPATLEASQLWEPSRAVDGKMVPEGTPVLTPVGSSFTPGCASLVLRLSEPHKVRSVLVQADAFDRYAIEVSQDGTTFAPAGVVERVQSSQYRTRVVELEADTEVRALRLYHANPRRRSGHIAEVAVFDTVVKLPALPQAPRGAHFVASYDRPAAMGLFARPTRDSGQCPYQWIPPEPRRRKVVLESP